MTKWRGRLAAFIFAALSLGFAAPSTAVRAETRAVRTIILPPGPLTETDPGRELLSYMIGCALPADVDARIGARAQDAAMHGGLGLAPDWSDRPLTQAEQELVSACVLARVNAFGVPVRISLRALDMNHPPPALAVTEDEKRTYPLFEGAFFGNIFARPPQMFACSGQATPRDLQQLERVCTLPTHGDETVCTFVLTGPCPSVGAPHARGRNWPNAIAVYLSKESNTE